jgi:hypothetical protein
MYKVVIITRQINKRTEVHYRGLLYSRLIMRADIGKSNQQRANQRGVYCERINLELRVEKLQAVSSACGGR